MAEHEVGSGLAGRRIREAGDAAGSACIIAIGKLVAAADRAVAQLAQAGVDVTLWDARCCAPLDPRMLADAAKHRAVITIEDGVVDGGIGSTIGARIGELNPAVVTTSLGLPTEFIPHASTPDEILGRLGLDAAGIAAAVRRAL